MLPSPRHGPACYSGQWNKTRMHKTKLYQHKRIQNAQDTNKTSTKTTCARGSNAPLSSNHPVPQAEYDYRIATRATEMRIPALSSWNQRRKKKRAHRHTSRCWPITFPTSTNHLHGTILCHKPSETATSQHMQPKCEYRPCLLGINRGA